MNDNETDSPEPDAPPDDERASDANGSRRLPVWLVPLLIGLVTITAGLFSWRAGQLASAAAYEDRQSVGQTIKQEQQRVEAGLATVTDAVAYVSYAADYAEAAALDSFAAEVAAQGFTEAAATVEEEAEILRRAATQRAESVGVFGAQSVLAQSVAESDEPIPFDIDTQLAENQAAVSTGITSPGVLDPDSWAETADDTRQRVRLLRWDTLLLLVAVLAYTLAELAPDRRVRRAGFIVGSLVYAVVTVSTFAGSFW